METLRTFLDHLYFSVVSILVSMLAVYAVLYIVDGAAAVWGYQFGFRNFSVGENLTKIVISWAVIALVLSGFLTHRTMKSRQTHDIEYTKRVG